MNSTQNLSIVPPRSKARTMTRNMPTRWMGLCAAAVFLTCIIFFYGSRSSISGSFKDAVRAGSHRFGSPDLSAANATLGFQKIIAVSHHSGWRTRGLLAAATLTGLQIDIPPQPKNADSFVEAFEKTAAGNGEVISHGSAMAWMAHLDIMKHVIASDLETALVIEDDVDWDVDIRKQTNLLAENVRTFTGATDPAHAPYGKEWDVLWIGHCGERIDKNSNDKLKYQDSTRIPLSKYAGWSTIWLVYLGATEREIQRGTQTVCTFSYAVTREGAQNVLKHVSNGSNEAFDVALANRCASRTLRCLTVNPELMHHYGPPEGSGYVSEVQEGDKSLTSSDETKFEALKGSTPNIVNSARCAALFGESCPAKPWYIPHGGFPDLKEFEDRWNSGE